VVNCTAAGQTVRGGTAGEAVVRTGQTTQSLQVGVVPIEAGTVAERVSPHEKVVQAGSAPGQRLTGKAARGALQGHGDVTLEIALKWLTPSSDPVEFPEICSCVAR
jgi:hypothetical protein